MDERVAQYLLLDSWLFRTIVRIIKADDAQPGPDGREAVTEKERERERERELH